MGDSHYSSRQQQVNSRGQSTGTGIRVWPDEAKKLSLRWQTGVSWVEFDELGFVEAHHGEISVDRDPVLGGARFTVELPLAAQYGPEADTP